MEVALNVFIGNFLNQMEKLQKPSSLDLLDLFAWTLRVNVEAHEKLRHLEIEETGNAQTRERVENERGAGLLPNEAKYRTLQVDEKISHRIG